MLTAGLLAACGGADSSGKHSAATTLPATTDNASLTASTPFYVAHRGGSANWPEMTMLAYGHAVAAGMKALEISVQRSSDGVFVGCHDATTARVTGVDKTVASTLWAELSTLSGKSPVAGQPAAPMARLETVLDAYASDHVIFLEDKTYKNAAPLLELVRRYPKYRDHFFWKVYGLSGKSAIAAGTEAGLPTWGYFFAAGMTHFAAQAPLFDWVGIDYHCTDAQLLQAKSAGKPMIGHVVSTAAQRDRLLAAGCRGIVLANVAGLAPKV
ncbi:MAG: glycerophosphodiester phosphodiesterase [Nakamurella sp.]